MGVLIPCMLGRPNEIRYTDTLRTEYLTHGDKNVTGRNSGKIYVQLVVSGWQESESSFFMSSFCLYIRFFLCFFLVVFSNLSAISTYELRKKGKKSYLGMILIRIN